MHNVRLARLSLRILDDCSSIVPVAFIPSSHCVCIDKCIHCIDSPFEFRSPLQNLWPRSTRLLTWCFLYFLCGYGCTRTEWQDMLHIQLSASTLASVDAMPKRDHPDICLGNAKRAPGLLRWGSGCPGPPWDGSCPPAQ